MLNHIIVMGRLVRDPELRYTQSQVPVANFTVAVDRDYSGKDAEKQTDFIDCIAWRGTGEFVNRYFSKGSMAVVSGQLQLRDWTDKDGNKRRNAEIVADNVYFGDSKKSNAQEEKPVVIDKDSGYSGESKVEPANYYGNLSEPEENLPF